MVNKDIHVTVILQGVNYESERVILQDVIGALNLYSNTLPDGIMPVWVRGITIEEK